MKPTMSKKALKPLPAFNYRGWRIHWFLCMRPNRGPTDNRCGSLSITRFGRTHTYKAMYAPPGIQHGLEVGIFRDDGSHGRYGSSLAPKASDRLSQPRLS